MSTSRSVLMALIGVLLGIGGGPVFGQSLEVGGQAFGDYFYVLSSPDTDEEALHGFTYRRLYLTTDFRVSEAFKGRARLEANGGTTGSKGPVPYVKDLFLRWTYGGAHSATVGVTSPPAFEVSDRVWGYRSLEKTILDLQGIVDSRDFGLRLDGPLAADGNLRYALMYANNSAARPESDVYKRIYTRLSATPTEHFVFVLGGDYAAYGDQRDRSVRVSVFAGYDGETVRVGLEGYGAVLTQTDTSEVRDMGVSLFGTVQAAERWELIARVDLSAERVGGTDRTGIFWLGGVAYRPHPKVALIPNVRFRNADPFAETDALARLTLEVDF